MRVDHPLARVQGELSALQRLTERESALHRLDPRGKLLVLLLYTLLLSSYDPQNPTALLPMSLFPFSLFIWAALPLRPLLLPLLLASPFALFMALGELFFAEKLSLGLLSSASILLRFLFGVSALLCILAVTGFQGICRGLQGLKLPKILVTQLLLSHRALQILLQESLRASRARRQRSFSGQKLSLEHHGRFLAQLLSRSVQRAERIQIAMRSRGFKGLMPLPPRSWRWADSLFLLSWSLLFSLMRRWDLSQLLGDLFLS